jgi:pyruvate formate lyase activating enzyme
MREAEYWRSEANNALRCLLCPNACLLEPGSKGKCDARVASEGKLEIPFYGAISSLALDPVEKKPLRHFLPGTLTFSVGLWHCTMHCPFCQNWEIAQPQKTYFRFMEPGDLVAKAVESSCPSISFTYSEPTLHIEYVKDCMILAREAGLKTILVTNGNILDTPARDILALTDAANIDLKSASGAIYKDILGGSLSVVHNFIRIASKSCHVEITTLIVPGISDETSQIFDIASFIHSLDRTIPLHLTPYFPAYRWDRPALSASRMKELAEPAYRLLESVHLTLPRYF